MKRLITTFSMSIICFCCIFAGGSKETNMVKPLEENTNSQEKEIVLESPYLSEMVKSGEIASLENRLPKKADIMIEDMEVIGDYNDSLTMMFKGMSDKWKIEKCFEEPLFRFREDGLVEPNVAKGFDVNDNSTEYIIYLREGMKWSDGVDFTADDCLFWYEHMMLKKTFGKSVYSCFYSVNAKTGEKSLCKMEKVDDYSFKVTFKDPSPMFLERVAIDCKWLFAPKHYYEKILPEFIGEEAAAIKAKELGFKDVASMGKETGYYYWLQLDRPVLRPWVLSNDIDSDLLVCKRNPYYWKTDKEGKQLPYIDEIHFVKYSDENQNVLKCISGEADITLVYFNDIVTVKQNEKKGDYSVLQWSSTNWSENAGALQFNLTCEDENLRNLFNNKDFRQALSIAVDREEISALLSDGFAKPIQACPPKGSQGYSEEWENKWTEYNPEKAKQLLKNAGLVMQSDGYFDFKDGTNFVLEIVSSNEESFTSKSAELLTEKYFKEIGIKATFSLRDRGLVDEMTSSNKITAVLAPIAPMSSISVALRPDTIVPIRNYAAWYGQYGTWYASNGKDGVKPIGDVAKLIELYDMLIASSTKAEIQEYSKQILKLHEENIWQIGYMQSTPKFIAVKNNLQNFPRTSILCDEFRELGLAHWQNLFFK